MEKLADAPFRRALDAAVGGFDEACTEFIRVDDRPQLPGRAAHGLVRRYCTHELPTTPLAAQIMGSNPHMMGAVTYLLAAEKGAPRVDLNCGCPAKVVTGKGAGSSLLRTPERLQEVVEGMCKGMLLSGKQCPVTVKMRSGFEDSGRLRENLLAAEDGGSSFITLHPRTKSQGYKGAAAWDLIGFAKDVVRIPVVGNGDVTSASHALAMRAATGCDGIMIALQKLEPQYVVGSGRGAVQDPFIFHKVKAAFLQEEYWRPEESESVLTFLQMLVPDMDHLRQQRKGSHLHQKACTRLKLVCMPSPLQQGSHELTTCRYLFKHSRSLESALLGVLHHPSDGSAVELWEAVQGLIRRHWVTAAQ
eukprot:SM000493S17371  [mRNA]  locus=s493:3072:5968:- [translate_table: standard]